MNIALWIAQVLLAGFYALAGGRKVLQPDSFGKNAQMTDGHIRFIGISELLGVLGLILPLFTGILVWLTPVAAIGLSIIQVLAIFTVHLPKKEFKILPLNTVLLALSVFVVFGRWILFP